MKKDAVNIIEKTHNLIIDIGNSHVKFLCFSRVFFNIDELIEFIEEEYGRNQILINIVIVSSVPQKNEFFLEASKEACLLNQIKTNRCQIFTKDSQNLISGFYEDIGSDRVAKLIGARAMFPENNLILMDFGTATTVSILSHDNVFLGGFIALGLKSSLKAISDYCAALEDFSKEDLKEFFFEDNDVLSPREAILQGTTQAHIGLVNQWLFKAKKIVEASKSAKTLISTICTGGEAGYFMKYFDYYRSDVELIEACFT